MKVSIHFRAALRSWFVLTLLFGFMGCVLYGLAQYNLIHHNDTAMEITGNKVQEILMENEDFERLTPKQIEKLDQMERIILFEDMQGKGLPFYRSKDTITAPIEDILAKSGLGPKMNQQKYGLVDDPRYVYRIHSQQFVSRAGRRSLIQVVEPLGAVPAIRKALRKSLWLVIPLGLAFLLGASFWITKQALSPITEVTRMARTIQAKGLHERLPHPGVDDELGLLVDTLNHMMSRLELSFDTMRRFTADASHELRSPLTTMRATIDITLGDPRTPAEYVETLESLGEDVNLLSGLTEGLLLLAKADADKIHLEKTRVGLNGLLRDVLDSFHADTTNTDLRLNSPTEVFVMGDERWLRQLFFNLVDNAIKFSKAHNGGTALVEVDITREFGQAQIQIRDSGPGVPVELMPRLFERFFRADTARGHGNRTRGYGLGLSIAAWIARVHEGTIAASNRPEGGLLMEVRLPLAKDSAAGLPEKTDSASAMILAIPSPIAS